MSASFDYGIRGHITESTPNVLRELIKISLERHDLRSFAGGLPANDLFDVEGLEMATSQVFRSNSRTAFQYNSSEGLLGLREQICRLSAARGIDISPSDVIPTTGSQQAIDLVARCLVEPGDLVLVERPTFITALQTFRTAEARIVGIDSDGEGPKLDAIEQAAATAAAEERRIKFIYLVPTFANPTGRIMSLQRRKDILKLVMKHGLVILEDDPYGELWFGEAPPPSIRALANDDLEASRHVLYVSSLSKTVSPGVRVGWIALPESLVAPFKHMKTTADVHSSLFAQAVMQHYLELDRLPARIDLARRTYRSKAATLTSALRSGSDAIFEFDEPAGGMFLWSKMALPGASIDFARFALDTFSVSVVPGEPFFDHDPETHWLRLSFTQGTLDEIREGAARLANAAHAWREMQS